MKTSFILFIIIFIYLPLKGQIDKKENFNKQSMMFGFDVQQFQKDYGIGVSVYSQSFWHNRVKVRGSVGGQWLEYIQSSNGLSTWQFYPHIRMGFQGRTAIIADKIYTYGEGGILFIFPSSSFSTKSFIQGGYGCFGFELFIQPKFSYYIELGGLGTGAVADKAVHQPIYSNGMLIAVGMRFAL